MPKDEKDWTGFTPTVVSVDEAQGLPDSKPDIQPAEPEQQLYDQAADLQEKHVGEGDLEGGDPDDDRGPEDYLQTEDPDVRLVSFEDLPKVIREGLRGIIDGADRAVDSAALDFDTIAERLQHLTVEQAASLLRDIYKSGRDSVVKPKSTLDLEHDDRVVQEMAQAGMLIELENCHEDCADNIWVNAPAELVANLAHRVLLGGGVPADEPAQDDVEARLQALEGPALTEAIRPRMVINIQAINADKAFFA